MTRPLSAALVLAAVLAPTVTHAQPKSPLLTVEDLYRFDGPRATALSPDGTAAVFIRQWIDAESKLERTSLWRVTGSRDAVAAEPGEPDARALVYSPDGKWIAFLSTRPRPDGWKPTPPVPPGNGMRLPSWPTM